jgi:high affinity Mn2+ porin
LQRRKPADSAIPIYGQDYPHARERTENFSIHGQFTNVTQYHPPFTSPFYGSNSLLPGHRGDETIDLTLFAGLRVWDGLEAYVNPEVDQGFGLSNTLGVAGFPSGEAYKIGMTDPYLRLPRAFFRYTLFLLVSFVSVCSRFWYSSFCS